MSPSAPAKKSKKPLIFIIIIFFLLVIGGIGYLVLTKTTDTARNVTPGFLPYANYILYGEENDSPIEGKFEEHQAYCLDRKLDDIDSSDYFTQANKLLGMAISNASNQTESLQLNFDEHRKTLNFITNYDAYGILTDKKLLDYFKSNGSDAALSYSNQFYSNYANLDYKYAAEFAELGRKVAKSKISAYEIFQQAGCLDDETCDDALVDSEILKASVQAQKSMNQIVTISRIPYYKTFGALHT